MYGFIPVHEPRKACYQLRLEAGAGESKQSFPSIRKPGEPVIVLHTLSIPPSHFLHISAVDCIYQQLPMRQGGKKNERKNPNDGHSPGTDEHGGRRAHGGKIWAENISFDESRKKRGVAVRFTLPLSE
jgi:hypothetical protein